MTLPTEEPYLNSAVRRSLMALPESFHGVKGERLIEEGIEGEQVGIIIAF